MSARSDSESGGVKSRPCNRSLSAVLKAQSRVWMLMLALDIGLPGSVFGRWASEFADYSFIYSSQATGMWPLEKPQYRVRTDVSKKQSRETLAGSAGIWPEPSNTHQPRVLDKLDQFT